jgi:hypothetical protein
MIFNNFPKLVAFFDNFTTKMKKITILVLISLLYFNCLQSQIVSFNFNTNPFVNAAYSNSNLEVSDLFLSTGVIDTNKTTGDYFSDEPYIEETGGWTAISPLDAKYFYLTLQAESGFYFTIDSIYLEVYATSAGPAALSFILNDSVFDAFNLPDASLQNLSLLVSESKNYTTLNLKIAAWNNGSRLTSGTGTLRIDNLKIFGNIELLPAMDSSSSLSGTDFQIPEVLSSLTTSANFIPVLEMIVCDSASGDGESTRIESIVFNAHSTNQLDDWAQCIDSVLLKGSGFEQSLTGQIEATKIVFNTSGLLEVAEGIENQDTLQLLLKLKKQLSDFDGKQLGLSIDASTIDCNSLGSQIGTGKIETSDGQLAIEIIGTRLEANFPPSVLFKDSLFNLTVCVTDSLGNVDLDDQSALSLFALPDNIALESVMGLSGNFSQGSYSFFDLSFNQTDTFQLVVQSDSYTTLTHNVWVGHPYLSADFENQSLNSWYHTGDWEISLNQPLDGDYSLKHAVANPDGISYIAAPFLQTNMNNGRMVWQMQLKNGDFDPTSTNRFWYYLMASDTTLSLPGVYGYAVGVNFSGSNDSLSLWRIDSSSTKTLLLQSALNWEANDAVAIEVIRDVPGTWQLAYKRMTSADSYQYTATVFDAAFVDLPYHGLVFNYSSTRAGLLWADALQFFQMNTPPLLIEGYGFNNSQIVLRFSEPVSKASATNIANYEVLNQDGNLSIDSIGFEEAFPQIVHLFLDLAKTSDYQVNVSALSDLEGALMEPQSTFFVYQVPALPGDIIINEIMCDPSPVVGLPEYDYLEIFNRGTNPFYLGNWKLLVGDVQKVLPDSMIQPGEYAILTSNTAVNQFIEFGTTLGVLTTTMLTNAGKAIGLFSKDGVRIDSLFYQPDWYQNPDKEDGGWSLERIDANNLCGALNNWHASLDSTGGTPGRPNSVAATNIDFKAPSIESLKVKGYNELTITLDEQITTQSATDTLNYILLSGNQIPDSVSCLLTSTTELTLYFAHAFVSETSYQIKVSGLLDPCGNVMADTLISFLFYLPQAGDVIINEIMADPSPPVGLPEVSYLELYNRSAWPIQLENWALQYGDYSRYLTQMVLEPGTYLLLSPVGTAVQLASFGSVMDILSTTSLSSTGKYVQLIDTSGLVVDAVNYNNTWYQDANKADGGWALERIDPENLCSAGVNWKASENAQGGTPAGQNSVFASNPDTLPPYVSFFKVLDAHRLYLEFSEPILTNALYVTDNYVLHGSKLPVTPVDETDTKVILELPSTMISGNNYTLKVWQMSDLCNNPMSDTLISFVFYTVFPDDVVFTEIMMDESPVVGLPEYEYLEIFNRSVNSLQLENWELVINGSSKKLSRKELEPNAYLILCHQEASEEFLVYGQVLGIAGFPTLPNTGASIQLIDTMQQLIGEVNYASSWYQNTEKDNGGWSLEVIDPNNTCGGMENWKVSANHLGGTPGWQNSVFSHNMDIVAPVVGYIYPLSDRQLVASFSEIPASSSVLQTSNYVLNTTKNPISVVSDSLDATSVILTFDEAWEQLAEQTLKLSAIADPCGNILTDTSVSFVYSVPKTYDVLFNEIMATPEPVAELPAVEYVELYNRSDLDIHAIQWEITIGSSERSLPYFYFPSHSYLLIADAENASQLASYGKVVELDNMPALPASGSVNLYQMNQKYITGTQWSSAWFASEFKAGGGYSLERIDENSTIETAENWRETESPQGGTPGAKNTVYASNPDITPPELLRAFPMNEALIRVEFSEPMAVDAFKKEFFDIDGSTSLIQQVNTLGSELQFIDLVLAEVLEPGVLYTLTVNQELTDLAGNFLDANQAQVAWPVFATPNDLVINEILYNPTSEGTDFVELYNRSSKTINLKQCYLASRDADLNLKQVRVISPYGALLFPGEYALLSENALLICQQYEAPNQQAFISMESMPSFSDDAGTLVLVDTLGRVIDEFSYSDDMQFALLQTTEGVSLERLSPERPASEKDNWHSAAETFSWATPGYQNSMFKELTAFTETIVVEPEAFSPDNDGYNDVVSFYYRFKKAGFVASVQIFDDKGRKIRTLINNELLAEQGVMVWDGLSDSQQKAAVGIYIVYFDVFDLDGARLQYKKVCVLNARF